MTALDDGHDDRELDLLLEAIFSTYHYDFRHYVRSSLRRRIAAAMSAIQISAIAPLRERILDDPEAFAGLLRHMTISVSDVFRDASYWRALREHVLPHLVTYPFLRVWIAGCGEGEEAYAMAILLAEEGLLEHAQIYATDISRHALAVAESGHYDLERVRAFSDNYFRAGGKASLSDYYVTTACHAAFKPELRRNILFSDHCLATDAAFAEVQLISCRNVFIYFDRTLQDRALAMFADALCPRGFLGLGANESLLFSEWSAAFEPVVPQEKLFRKRVRGRSDG